VTNEAGLENKVREAVKFLTELQAIDDELRDIALERGDLPEEVDRLLVRIQEYEEFIAERRQEFEESTRTISERTQQLEDSRAKQVKLQQQLYAVKTTREYDAITAEFNFVKEEIAKCEADIAAATQRKADRLRQIEERQGELDKVRVEERAKSSDLKEKLAETEAEERELLHRRENVVVRIMKPLYAHYERIRKVKDGRGVARIMDGACGGCFAVIPPQTQVNIRKLTDIVLCETCGRIIVP
jgi:uncharacterized protein